MSSSSSRHTPQRPAPQRARRRTLLVVLAAVVALLTVVIVLRLAPGSSTPRPAPSGGETTQEGSSVDVESFGAVGDGRTDDTAALQRALDEVSSGTELRFRAGATYVQSDVLRLERPGVHLTGDATILAVDEERSSLTIAADDVVLDGLTLRIEGVTKRWDAFEQQRLRIDGTRGVEVRDVTVDGSAAAGVYVAGSATDFLLEDVEVVGTRADGIHITRGSSDGRIVRPVTRGTGDDGVAVVSYEQDGDPCRDITVESPVIDGTTGGRGVSVVGGEDVRITDVDIRRTAAAAVYVAAEGDPYFTTGVRGVSVVGGRVDGANVDTDIDHGAVLVYDGRADATVVDVRIAGVTISGTRESASRQIGVLASQPGVIDQVVVEDLDISGGPQNIFGTDDPAQGYTVRDVRRDGAAQPDRFGQG